MSCDPLPGTGLDGNVELFLLLAVGLVVTGALTVLLARRRGAAAALAGALLLGCATTLLGLGAPAPAQAAADSCSSSSSPSSLEVTQTSTMTGLAPGVAPVPITGRLENHSEHSTYVTAVDVEITSISTVAGASAACRPSDYRLSGSRMPVGRTLAPGASTPFTGASIGFANLAHDQDVCQGATVHLRYTANPD